MGRPSDSADEGSAIGPILPDHQGRIKPGPWRGLGEDDGAVTQKLGPRKGGMTKMVKLGDIRTVMIEGPSREALELVEIAQEAPMLARGAERAPRAAPAITSP
jgi:hypothetical protein